MATSVLGSTAGKLLVLCVLTSATASTQTTIMPTARAVLSMAAYRALPARFARTSERFRTPTFATVAMGVISASFYLVLTVSSKNVLADSASATGLLIAFYYGLTGFSCVWYFRRELGTSVHNLVFKGVLPLLGALALLGAFVLSIKSFLPASSSYSSLGGVGGVFVIGAGALAVGVALMVLLRWRTPAFFTSGAGTPSRLSDDRTHVAEPRPADSLTGELSSWEMT
jgi:amino acid transporter